MGGLTSSLNIAVNSLMADQGALNVTSNNIANANTPNYTVESPVLVEQAPAVYGNILLGQGVELQNIQTVRDQVLQSRINQETQTQGQVNSYLGGMNQVQALFNEAQGVGLQNVMSQFFNSLQTLSTNPTDASLRQGVLSAGQALAGAFNQAANGLSQVRSGLDQSVAQNVTQINQLTSQIAQLNSQINALQGTPSPPNTLLDQRNQLVTQLSQYIGVNAINTTSGTFELTTTNGSALVVGQSSFALQSQLNTTDGLQHIFAQGSDITSSITGGQLGGLLQARDQSVPATQASLDTLAYNLATAFNAQSTSGYDVNGNPGVAFFNQPSTVTGSAAQMSVAISDPNLIAASSDGTPGSNGNALALAAIQNQPLINGQNVTDYYSGLVNTIGNDVAGANTQQQSVSGVLTQLQNQLSSESGVSINQEAANLVQFQNAYQASAQVVTIVQQLFQSTLNMV
jgi:flagellar hook-associated protein 1 FlgK